ncbi:TrbM/KikA/MpfK family conjugal transfer protein [Marilutibacter chinensis]|uniref:Conjugal transfer protein TrbM n=1 Tax=Marilutibacter chinensis TaxID=2912247 RepID=A0ABS9HSJ9_9GAMM|nr:TrbM/KikA/MpfK family conjugal transfer protein [Lysobacter chinensis]MCF7221653.1 conjugal transfer protein TrbM [Lysobacter chinensis]
MRKKLLVAALALAGAFGSIGSASAQDMLTGDTRLACEAILCLSSGTRPGECSPSLSRYFGIKMKKLSDTLKARLNFLQLCPASSQSSEMSNLVEAISRGAGRCDAQSLNRTLVFWRGSWDDGDTYISNQMPGYCAAYTGHQYTDLDDTAPRYVGDPNRGGHWVESQNYESALAAYNDRIRKEDEARRNGLYDYRNSR